MKTTYEDWKADVTSHLNLWKAELDFNQAAKELYNGFYIWDSKFLQNPEIMFLGINPGNGNPANNGSINIEPTEEMGFIEYLDGDNPTYKLARTTVEIFKRAGYAEEELRILFNDKSVKTNFYYIITNTEPDIKRCFDSLGPGRFDEFWLKSFHWTGQLISIVRPKVIICEGKGIFNVLKEIFEEEGGSWEDDCGYFELPEESMTVLGYSRKWGSNMEAFSDLVKKYVKK